MDRGGPGPLASRSNTAFGGSRTVHDPRGFSSSSREYSVPSATYAGEPPGVHCSSRGTSGLVWKGGACMSATCPAASHHITAAAVGTSTNGRPFLLPETGAPVTTSDRKSTRLNSSHLG